MLGLGFRFDLGRYHATPWGSHVNEAAIEWPPSPWRILRALYSVGATDVTLADDRPRLDAALVLLAGAPDPSYVVPRSVAAHTRHYVPLARHSPTAPGETSLVIDAFKVVRRDADLQVWWDVELPAAERDALMRAVASLGYLGRSESVCTARVLPDAVAPAEFDAIPAGGAAAPSPWGSRTDRVDLLAVSPQATDPLQALTVSVAAMRKDRRLVPPGSRRVGYVVRAPEDSAAPSEPIADVPGPSLAHLRVGRDERPAFTEATVVAHVLRAALQRTFDRDGTGLRSPVLSGHGEDGKRTDQHRHAHYLALPGRDRRQVEHLFVWAPEGLPPAEVEAISRLSWLRMRDHEAPCKVALVALGDAESMEVQDLLGPREGAHTWRSVTPFSLPRHPKARRGRQLDGPADQIVRELAWRELPEPRSVELLPGRWMDFARARPGQPARSAGRVVGARITFAEPVRGPIALGRLSHFGLGLFAAES